MAKQKLHKARWNGWCWEWFRLYRNKYEPIGYLLP